MYSNLRVSKKPQLIISFAAVVFGVSLFVYQMWFPPRARAASPNIVISQVYGGGGNSGATYTHDFIELFNRGTSPVSISGWSLQYTSATGTGNFAANATLITELPAVSINPGQYFLVQEASTAAVGSPLPAPDFIDATPIAMAAGAGKVALVNTTTPLGCNGGSTPCAPAALATIVDLVGYGNANFFEGAAPAPTLTNTTAASRINAGCTDTDNNSGDFAAAAPNPRNTASPLNSCPLSLSINDVSLNEGDSGPTTFTFTVTLSAAAPAGGVTFDIATADGMAQDGNPAGEDSDYVAKAETGRTISAGSSSATFSVTVNGDGAVEPNETFFVNVSNVTGAAVSDSQGLGTIINDDFVLTAIHDIQGNGTSSPFNTQTLTTTGVVTARKSNGFFIQTPDGSVDSDPETSEGLFVFTSSAPPAAAAVGNLVRVTGMVQEFRGDPNSPPLTEIGNSPAVFLISSGNPLPAPVILNAAETTAPSETSNPLDSLEEYEGMRVTVPSLTVVAPTQGSINEANATATSNGVFYGVVTGVPRPFREPGIAISNPVPPPNPPAVPRFDENPQRLRVDSDGQVGATSLEVTTGATIANMTGVLDYGFRTYTILPDVGSLTQASVVGNQSSNPIPDPTSGEFTVASFNTLRFFDSVNDPGISDPVLTPTAYSNRLNKISLVIRNVLRKPDVIGVQEVEKLSVLQDIANKVNADSVAAGGSNPNYVAYLVEGNDIGGIDVGFLVKSSRVNVVDVTQVEQPGCVPTLPITCNHYTNPNDGQPDILNDRPPLILQAEIQTPGGSMFPFTVIVNHLRSLTDAEDPVDGNRVRTKRRAQAEFLADLLQSRQSSDPMEKIIVVGDMNAYELNDGLVDVIGTIKGQPAPASEVVLPSLDLVNPDFIDLVSTLPPSQRYSFTFDGNAQVLDHILVSQSELSLNTHFLYARINADFPAVFFGDPTRPERVSDHDPAVGYFVFPPPSADLSITKADSPDPVVTGSNVTYQITVTNNGIDNATQVVVSDNLPAETTFVSCSSTGSGVCGGIGNNRKVTFSSLAIGASATITIVANVKCELPNNSVISNTVSVISDTADPDTSNNSYTTTTTASNPPPTITNARVDKTVLWPPNHKMVDVNVDYGIADNCGPVICALTVTSNEPINGTGDGDTAPDWMVVSDHQVRLRAERSGGGAGRVYTTTITCTDSAGGSSSKRVTTLVSKSQGNSSKKRQSVSVSSSAAEGTAGVDAPGTPDKGAATAAIARYAIVGRTGTGRDQTEAVIPVETALPDSTKAVDVSGQPSTDPSRTPKLKISLLYDPTNAVKSGATYPVKIRLGDVNGNNISSPDTRVHAVGVGKRSSSTDREINPDPVDGFRFEAGVYIFEIRTTGFAPGTYNLYFTAGDDPTVYAVPFRVK